MRGLLFTVVALLLTALLFSQVNKKTWQEAEGCVRTEDGHEQPMCFYFMEDRETHTRCYAVRADMHDGAAISCVKQ